MLDTNDTMTARNGAQRLKNKMDNLNTRTEQEQENKTRYTIFFINKKIKEDISKFPKRKIGMEKPRISRILL